MCGGQQLNAALHLAPFAGRDTLPEDVRRGEPQFLLVPARPAVAGSSTRRLRRARRRRVSRAASSMVSCRSSDSPRRRDVGCRRVEARPRTRAGRRRSTGPREAAGADGRRARPRGARRAAADEEFLREAPLTRPGGVHHVRARCRHSTPDLRASRSAVRRRRVSSPTARLPRRIDKDDRSPISEEIGLAVQRPFLGAGAAVPTASSGKSAIGRRPRDGAAVVTRRRAAIAFDLCAQVKSARADKSHYFLTNCGNKTSSTSQPARLEGAGPEDTDRDGSSRRRCFGV